VDLLKAFGRIHWIEDPSITKPVLPQDYTVNCENTFVSQKRFVVGTLELEKSLGCTAIAISEINIGVLEMVNSLQIRKLGTTWLPATFSL
jgi:hypothetical protein